MYPLLCYLYNLGFVIPKLLCLQTIAMKKCNDLINKNNKNENIMGMSFDLSSLFIVSTILNNPQILKMQHWYNKRVNIVTNKKVFMESKCCWPCCCGLATPQNIMVANNSDENIKWLNQSKQCKQNHYEKHFWFVKRFNCEYNMI